MTDAMTKLLEAALPHVAFDGWSEAVFCTAIDASGVDATLARAFCPRGSVDLALAFHESGDAEMVTRLKETDLSEMRFRDRIALAVRTRLEVAGDKEVVRRGAALFSLPHLAPDGFNAMWQTSDVIWVTLGDTSDDLNWYTKRATLSSVYSATLLFWLGDDSADHQASWAFLDRRIENVMQFEKFKAKVREYPVLSKLLAGPGSVLSQLRAPRRRTDLPGRWPPQNSVL